MEWAPQRVRSGELSFEPRRYLSRIRYDWVRKWAHLHIKVKVVGVFDTVGSLSITGWVHQLGQDIDWHATKQQRIAAGDFLRKLNDSNGVVQGIGSKSRLLAARVNSGYGGGYDIECPSTV